MAPESKALSLDRVDTSEGDLKEQEESLLALIEALEKHAKDFRLDTGFNLFEAVGMTRQEIRHSRFLAFLLDPNGPHGLGSAFLRSILAAAIEGHPNSPVSRLDVAIADLGASEVHCERDHFDIAVEVPSLRLLFVIENKIDALESANQLMNYKERAVKKYGGVRFLGAFLTPTGYQGEDGEWGVLDYTTIVSALRPLLDTGSVAHDVKVAMMHYIQLIERKIVPSQALIDACKAIYKQHRSAFDLVAQHGQESVVAQAFDQFVEQSKCSLRSTAVRSNTVHFVFDEWLTASNFPQADRKRWSSNFPVVMWFEVKVDRLHFRLEVGPLVEVERRPGLVELLRKSLPSKGKAAAGKTRGEIYTRVLTERSALPDDPGLTELCDAMIKTWTGANGERLKDTVLGVIAGLPLGPEPLPAMVNGDNDDSTQQA